jgi:hypothetical protein
VASLAAWTPGSSLAIQVRARLIGFFGKIIGVSFQQARVGKAVATLRA